MSPNHVVLPVYWVPVEKHLEAKAIGNPILPEDMRTRKMLFYSIVGLAPYKFPIEPDESAYHTEIITSGGSFICPYTPENVRDIIAEKFQ